ncbi:hypothetical protein VNI00_005294 [Paramarasmius palmivorus]|uniref:Uncharacterized protein n=1 Tax=Paramarasmius palmivorus TaxID=297713 RepID=A0AAW0DHH6_9AGAR
MSVVQPRNTYPGSVSVTPTSTQRNGFAAKSAQGYINSAANTTNITNQSSLTHQQQQSSTTTTSSSVIQSVITQEVQSAMTHVLSNVPWIKFRVHAEPDLQVFQTDARLQQALTQISQATATTIAQTITTEFTSQMETLIQSVTKTATAQISATMVELIQQLITVSTLTHFSTNAGPLIIPGIPDCGDNGVIVDPVGPTEPIGPITKPSTKPPSLPDLGTASWIWTKEVLAGNPPGGARPFRKAFTAKVPVDNLVIDITCDNYYTLYVNGYLVGSGRDWTKSQRYRVTFRPTYNVVVAVYGVQDTVYVAQAGVIASAVAWSSTQPNAPAFTFGTDASWKTVATPNFSNNFFTPGFDDSTWDDATVEGPYGMPPWGPVPKPIAYTPQNAGLNQLPGGVPDAPDANAATVLTE